MKIELPEIALVQDSREQNGYGPLFLTHYVVETLSEGDYSIAGLEDRIAIERKSFQDFLNSVTNSRSRFEAELRKARSYHKFFVLVECSPADLLVSEFGKLSHANPRAIWGTLCHWSCRYAPIIFGQDRPTSARLCEGLLTAYAKEYYRGAQLMEQAARRLATG